MKGPRPPRVAPPLGSRARATNLAEARLYPVVSLMYDACDHRATARLSANAIDMDNMQQDGALWCMEQFIATEDWKWLAAESNNANAAQQLQKAHTAWAARVESSPISAHDLRART